MAVTDRHDLVDRFPTSMSKYKASVVAATIKDTDIAPCQTLYDRTDHYPNQTVEELAEDLAFNHTEAVRKFLDVKRYRFRSRTIDNSRLVDWLYDTFDYDRRQISDFEDDFQSLFIILFYETYSPEETRLLSRFREAQTAAHAVSDKRDRMTVIEESVDAAAVESGVTQFQSGTNNGAYPAVQCEVYDSDRHDDVTVLLFQESGRSMVPVFEFRENGTTVTEDPSITHVENNELRQTAIRFAQTDDGTEVRAYRSVKSWDDALSRLFSHALDANIVEDMVTRDSEAAGDIVKNVKQASEEDESGTAPVAAVFETEISRMAANKAEEKDIGQSQLQQQLQDLTVTGVEIDDEDVTFEIHADESIYALTEQIDGLNESLRQSLAAASVENVTLYADIDNPETSDDCVVMENGEWYMEGQSPSMSNIELLEKILT